MPAPPITPSPHRFVLSQDTRGRPPSHSQRQFKPTPRFSFSSSLRHREPDSSTPVAAQQVQKSNEQEDIDSAPSARSSGQTTTDEDDDEEEEEDDEIPLPRQTNAEQRQGEEEEGSQSQELLSRPSKRPRHHYYFTRHEINASTNSNDDPIPSSSPSAAPRFHNVEQPPATTTTPRAEHHHQQYPHPHPTIKQPFILPPDPPRAQSPPLSLLFSPHRTNRHQSSRFVPGGLASEVREWVIHTSASSAAAGSSSSSAAPAHGRRQGQGRHVLRVLVEESRFWEAGGGGGEGGWFVLGSRLVGRDGNEDRRRAGAEQEVQVQGGMKMKMLLVGGRVLRNGQQQMRGLDKGDMLGLRQPIWDIVLQGERWSVGVDWSVL
ncbi:MAG: hypothetical protein M1816_001748 [Peltula sp. TS41687]|nr:MAG: hypothetical protein M1816_001748 [Peltula sp. TS41687]